jgi:hypothetical protein
MDSVPVFNSVFIYSGGVGINSGGFLSLSKIPLNIRCGVLFRVFIP